MTEPGIYQNTAEEYHSGPELSSSGARKIVNDCPALYRYEQDNPTPPTAALNVGSAAHEWLLEGESWPLRHHVLPEDFNGRTNAGKALLADIEESGKRALRHDEFEAIKAMVAALRAHEYAGHAFVNGTPEQSLYWSDMEFNIPCRARLDWMPNGGSIFADYKTTRSADPDYLQKAMHDYGYHQQAEWYLAGVRALGIHDSPRMLFVFQEKKPPYLVTCATPSEAALGWAEIQNRKAREIFAQCSATGVWPGYVDDILTLDLPAWAEKKLEWALEFGTLKASEETK